MLCALLYQQLFVYLLLCSLGATVIAVIGLSGFQITKRENTLSAYILEGTITTASGIRGYFHQLLKYHVVPCLWFLGVHIKC